MTDEPNESGPNGAIPDAGVRRPGTSIGLPRLTPQEQDAVQTAQAGNPFLAPTQQVPPQVQAIPTREAGFVPRPETPPVAAVRPPVPVAGSPMPPPMLVPPPPAPPMSSPYMPSPEPFAAAPDPSSSGRRRGAVIGASAAAAVAVAIGAISLTQGSSSPATADARSGAGFPGSADPTGGSRDGGQPLDGSTSRAGGQDVEAGSASSVAAAPGSNAPVSGAPDSGAPMSQGTNPYPSAPTTATAPPVVAPTTTAAAKPTTTQPVPTTPTTPPKTTTTPPPPTTSSKNMSCTGWATTHVVSQDGSGYAASGTFAMRSGPYAACANVGSFSSGQHMYIWCHVVNGYGNTWVYGRIDGTSTPHWQSISNFKPGATLGPLC